MSVVSVPTAKTSLWFCKPAIFSFHSNVMPSHVFSSHNFVLFTCTLWGWYHVITMVLVEIAEQRLEPKCVLLVYLLTIRGMFSLQAAAALIRVYWLESFHKRNNGFTAIAAQWRSCLRDPTPDRSGCRFVVQYRNPCGLTDPQSSSVDRLIL